jgi:hypothetical protein
MTETSFNQGHQWQTLNVEDAQGVDTWVRFNDPSAGSPTETLLRLLLPLNDAHRSYQR